MKMETCHMAEHCRKTHLPRHSLPPFSSSPSLPSFFPVPLNPASGSGRGRGAEPGRQTIFGKFRQILSLKWSIWQWHRHPQSISIIFCHAISKIKKECNVFSTVHSQRGLPLGSVVYHVWLKSRQCGPCRHDMRPSLKITLSVTSLTG